MPTEFGRRLKIYRADKGYKLYDMAKFLGITSSYLGMMETGKKKFNFDFMDKIKEFLELDDNQVEELKKWAKYANNLIVEKKITRYWLKEYGINCQN